MYNLIILDKWYLDKMYKKISIVFLVMFIISGCGDENSNRVNRTSVVDEPYYSKQWYLEYNSSFYDENEIDSEAHIHSLDFLDTYRGNGVKIAIIDDGLDVTHEDLNSTILSTYDIETNSTNVQHTSSNGYHGTAVTGIIAAGINGIGIAGIASESQILFLKTKPQMSDSETIELFNKAEDFGADIINCSWGTYDVSPAVKDKIISLSKNGRDGKGTIIVFANGNSARYMGNDESAIPEVISVGSSDINNKRAWYSNYGENLDILAPGGYKIGITTLDKMGVDGIGTIDDNYILYNDDDLFIGSSASAPIITGIIALMLEKNPNLTRLEVENILQKTADKIGELNYDDDGRNDYYGFGKVNLNNIMN